MQLQFIAGTRKSVDGMSEVSASLDSSSLRFSVYVDLQIFNVTDFQRTSFSCSSVYKIFENIHVKLSVISTVFLLAYRILTD